MKALILIAATLMLSACGTTRIVVDTNPGYTVHRLPAQSVYIIQTARPSRTVW